MTIAAPTIIAPISGGMRRAMRLQRAEQALRGADGAQAGTEIHHRLCKIARPIGRSDCLHSSTNFGLGGW